MTPFILSAVIPTKNRPRDLERAVTSLLKQKRPLDNLVIVDQSDNNHSKKVIEKLCSLARIPKLDYIYDPKINGLVAAKNVGLSRVTGQIVCFLEDDVILEPDYFSALESGFINLPDMLGCCGVVTNTNQRSVFYRFVFHFFHRGIFFDPRVGIEKYGRMNNSYVSSPMLSGGISAWRREVFGRIQFDLYNDFFMLEDIEFSTRARAQLGDHFFINTAARLHHTASPLNRGSISSRQRRKVREYLVFYKKRMSWPTASYSMSLLLFGLLLEAIYTALRFRSPRVILNYFLGIFDGVRWKVKIP